MPDGQTEGGGVVDSLQTPEQTCQMFAAVAPRYRLLNSVLTGCMDKLWRKALVEGVLSHHPRRVVDVATGTGDVLAALRSAAPEIELLGLDFCWPMIRLAADRQDGWLVVGDASHLPLQKSVADAVTVAFGLRNFPDRRRFLREAARVLRPQGRLWILEFSQPDAWFAWLYFAVLRCVMPTMARLLGAPIEAYQYLGESIRAFPSAQELAKICCEEGFREVEVRRFLAGAVALHGALRAETPSEPAPAPSAPL